MQQIVVLLSGGGDSGNESAAEPAIADDASKNIPSAVKPGSKVTGTELFGLHDEVRIDADVTKSHSYSETLRCCAQCSSEASCCILLC